MATFSRGICLLPCRRVLVASPPRSFIFAPAHAVGPSRHFTTTSLVRVRSTGGHSPATKASKNPNSIPATSKLPASKQPRSNASPNVAQPAAGTTASVAAASNVAPSRYAFIKSLSGKQTPTVLYEAPSHFWFYFGCWSSGLSILAWVTLTGPTVVDQPEGTPQWVGFVFGASYVLLGGMGFYLISKTPNIVSTIRILPTAAAATPAGAATAGSPQLEIAVKRMIPFIKPKVITANLDNVALKSRFSLPEEYVPQLKRLELKRQEEERRKALHKFDMAHLLTMPFRRIGRAFANMFNGVRAAWTDMGYGVMRVDGKDYKVDVTKGFAHDGFVTLERLVTVGIKE